MFRTIALGLHNFSPIPAKLRKPGDPADHLETITVDLAKLYHHYYVDSYGVGPPDPDPTNFEHIQFLMPGPEFRFGAPGLGVNKTKKGNASNELGQAFCRWFLDEFLNITHFAHFDEVCGHGSLAKHGGISISHTGPNLAPDYFCSSAATEVYLAEAKGDSTSVNFNTKKFESWRKQFDGVVVLDPEDNAVSIKGFIVATRWAFESKPGVKARINAEDPATRGEQSLGDFAPLIASAVVALHYAKIMDKLRFAPLAAVLRSGVRLPEELQFPATIWQFRIPPLSGKRFVGGYFPSDLNRLPIEISDDGTLIVTRRDPFRLDLAGGTFFGIEEWTFERLVKAARNDPGELAELPRFGPAPFVDSSVSILSDGTALAPVQLLAPIDQRLF